MGNIKLVNTKYERGIEGNYTSIQNEVLFCKCLSSESKIFYAFILCNIQRKKSAGGFNFSDEFFKGYGYTQRTITRHKKELIRVGLLAVDKVNDHNGEWKYLYTLYDVPQKVDDS